MFWTPINETLFYSYNEQFCLRFPLLFFVTFILGGLLTLSLQKSQYDNSKHVSELEKMTEKANNLAKYDPLTNLSNRRCVYEEVPARFEDNGNARCIVMGDIDFFKK